MSDRFWSLFTRQREPESRVHTELTKRSRERLANITDIPFSVSGRAFDRLIDEVGYTEVNEPVSSSSHRDDHISYILEGDTILVLSYIEHFLREAKREIKRSRMGTGPTFRNGNFTDMVEKIRDVLITEGLLWDIDNSSGSIQFHPLESEAMEDIDTKVQALAEKEPWDDALKGYNAAFERYLDGDFDEIIPKKLYNSIEEVLKTICVDLEGWTDDRDSSHAKYLDLLKEHDVYNANGITAPELGSLLNTLVKMVSKVSDERHQRHAYHDRAYCTLLIHQVGAYLYFLIGRYDDFSG